VLNFGPEGDGSIRKEEVNIAKQIGDWMKENSEAIYDCQYADLKKQDWGYFTKQDSANKIYMIVCNVPVSDALRVQLPKGIKISKTYSLSDKFSEPILEEIGHNDYFIHVEHANYNKPFVIVLETEKNKGGKKYRDSKT
jgi:alpha-L-fucosidase